MNALRVFGLVVTLTTLGLLPRAEAQPQGDPRTLYVTNDPGRYFRDTGNGRWAEYKNNRLHRMHREVGRTDRFIEIYTEDPQPANSRLTNTGIVWRLANENQWRQGAAGGWKDPLTERLPW
jgi:hypothetical protein